MALFKKFDRKTKADRLKEIFQRKFKVKSVKIKIKPEVIEFKRMGLFNFDNLWGERPAPKSAFEDAYSFYFMLKKRGFEFLGSGANSYVMAKKNSDRVIKVIKNPADGWMDYVQWSSKKGYGGSFAPAVYSYKYIKGSKSDFALAVIERMEKTFRDVARREDHAIVPGLLSYYLQDENKMAGTMLQLAYPGVHKFAEDFRTAFSEFDLHGGNFMLRKDGSFVLVDPVYPNAKGSTVIKTRLKARDFSLAA